MTVAEPVHAAPLLDYPLNQGSMILDSDASDIGIGTLLVQVQENKTTAPHDKSC